MLRGAAVAALQVLARCRVCFSPEGRWGLRETALLGPDLRSLSFSWFAPSARLGRLAHGANLVVWGFVYPLDPGLRSMSIFSSQNV